MPSLETLFQNHLADLRDVTPSLEDVFICPICKKQYSFEKDKLTRGDIWPAYIRQKSKDKSVGKQIVLICRDCNSRAGQYGDLQMQLIEQIRDGNEKGELYGRRIVQITDRAGDNSIRINTNVKVDNDTKAITLSGKLDNKGLWIGNNPEMQKRFTSLVGKNEPLSIFIDSTPIRKTEPKPELASPGWITSAYLFAFYTFGYRYILHPALEPVREYILSSFDKAQHKNLKTQYASFGLQECIDKFFDSPTLKIIVPLEKEPIHLEIHVFKYRIKLPFHCVPSVLFTLVQSKIPNIIERLPELKKSGELIYFQVEHSKAKCAECALDYLLGKPIPRQT